jgi:hypothetical protein
MKTDNGTFERVEEFKYLGTTVQIFGNNFNKSKLYSGKSKGQNEVREGLLSIGAESFVF